MRKCKLTKGSAMCFLQQKKNNKTYFKIIIENDYIDNNSALHCRHNLKCANVDSFREQIEHKSLMQNWQIYTKEYALLYLLLR